MGLPGAPACVPPNSPNRMAPIPLAHPRLRHGRALDIFGRMIQPHSKASESLDEIRERRLQATMAAVAAAHPFYRERIPQRVLTSVRTLDDLQLLPLTTKNDYIADPESFRL